MFSIFALILNPFFFRQRKRDRRRSATQTGLNTQAFNAACVIIQRPHPPPAPPSLTHAAAHFLGHLFLRLFQLFEEFASQIEQIPTATSKAPHPAICLLVSEWSLHRPSSSSASSCSSPSSFMVFLLFLFLLVPLLLLVWFFWLWLFFFVSSFSTSSSTFLMFLLLLLQSKNMTARKALLYISIHPFSDTLTL